jgi:heme-degrading monooxygenase HmoA
MYLHLELKTMSTERLTEAVARLNYLHTLMSGTPGFVDAQICEYLGNPGQYLVVRTWVDQASHHAYRQSDASKEFAASRPAHFIYDNLAVQEWLTFAETPGVAIGGYVVRELHDVTNWQVFAASQGHRGPSGSRTFRMLAKEGADDTQALVLQRWPGRDPYAASLEGVAKSEAALIECYAVVDEVLPQTL